MNSTPHNRHALLFIVITVTIDAIGFGIILPVMPKLIMELTGLSVGQAAFYGGALWFAYAIVQFFSAPIIGNLSDRFGRRPVLLFALAALGVDYLIMGLAPTLAWLFLGRIIAGIAGASYSTANAYVADISTPENRAQNFGLLGAAFGGGFVLGPVIGGLLGEIGPRIPFYAAAVLSSLNVIYGFFVCRESLAPENRRPFAWRRANPIGALIHLRINPVVFGLAIALFLYMLGHYSLPSVWTFYVIEKFSWTEKTIGLTLGLSGILMIMVQAGLIRVVIPKFGATRAGAFGLIAMSLGFMGYAFAANGAQMVGWLVVASLGGLVMPAFQSAMTSQVAANSQGELQGAISSLMGATTIIGPVLMTQLFGYFTDGNAPIYFPGVSFFVASLLTLITLIIFVSILGRKSKSATA